MQLDAKKLPWVYLIVGIIAMVGVGFFLYLDAVGGDHTMMVFDWAFFALGGVAVYRGVRGLIDQRKGGDGQE